MADHSYKRTIFSIQTKAAHQIAHHSYKRNYEQGRIFTLKQKQHTKWHIIYKRGNTNRNIFFIHKKAAHQMPNHSHNQNYQQKHILHSNKVSKSSTPNGTPFI